MTTTAEVDKKVKEVKLTRDNLIDTLEQMDMDFPDMTDEMVKEYIREVGWFDRNAKKFMESKDKSTEAARKKIDEERRFSKAFSELYHDKLRKGKIQYGKFKTDLKNLNSKPQDVRIDFAKPNENPTPRGPSPRPLPEKRDGSGGRRVVGGPDPLKSAMKPQPHNPKDDPDDMAEIMRQIAEAEKAESQLRASVTKPSGPPAQPGKPITESQEMAEIMRQIAEAEEKERRDRQSNRSVTPAPVNYPSPPPPGKPITESQEMADIMRQIAEAEARERGEFPPTPQQPQRTMVNDNYMNSEAERQADFMRGIAQADKSDQDRKARELRQMVIADAERAEQELRRKMQEEARRADEERVRLDAERLQQNMRNIAAQEKAKQDQMEREAQMLQKQLQNAVMNEQKKLEQQQQRIKESEGNQLEGMMRGFVGAEKTRYDDDLRRGADQLQSTLGGLVANEKSRYDYEIQRGADDLQNAMRNIYGAQKAEEDLRYKLQENIIQQNTTNLIGPGLTNMLNADNFAHLLGDNLNTMTSKENIARLDEKRMIDLTNMLTKNETELSKIRSVIAYQKEEEASVTGKLHGLRNLNTYIRIDIDKLNNSHRENVTEKERLQKEVAALEQDLAELDREVEEARNSNQHALHSNSDIRAEKALYRENLQKLDIEIERYKGSYTSLKRRWDEELRDTDVDGFAAKLDMTYRDGVTDLTRSYLSHRPLTPERLLEDNREHERSLSPLYITRGDTSMLNRTGMTRYGGDEVGNYSTTLLNSAKDIVTRTSMPSSYAERYLNKDFKRHY